ncbi:MAG: site-specific integrase [Leptospirales bacterium]|nr:site-specific integrase [Leptospirales bacterium]
MLPSTGIDTYDYHIAAFNEFLGRRGLSPALVHQFFEIKRKRYATNTLRSMRTAMRKGLRLCGKIPDEYTSGLQFRNVRRMRRNNLFSVEEVRRLVKNCPRHVGLMFRFLFSTGSRVSAALGIRIEDCRIDGEGVSIPITSKGMDHEIKISCVLFHEIRNEFKGKTFLFEHHGRPYSRKSLYAYARQYGLNILNRGNLSPHKLKHALVSFLLAEGYTIGQVSERVGTTAAVISQFYDLNSIGLKDIAKIERSIA